MDGRLKDTGRLVSSRSRVAIADLPGAIFGIRKPAPSSGDLVACAALKNRLAGLDGTREPKGGGEPFVSGRAESAKPNAGRRACLASQIPAYAHVRMHVCTHVYCTLHTCLHTRLPQNSAQPSTRMSSRTPAHQRARLPPTRPLKCPRTRLCTM